MRQSASKDKLLAAAVKYVKRRGNVYQYERRVPVKVQREPAHFAIHFDSQPLFRRSLRTKDQLEMHAACVVVHLEFEQKIAAVTGRLASALAVQIASPQLRKVTQADLESLHERYRALTYTPIERAHIKADADAAHAEEYERIIYDMELDAEDAAKALDLRGGGGGRFETPAEIAAWVIANESWDAPPGSNDFGAVAGTIRAAIRQGNRDAQALMMGEALPRIVPPSEQREERVPTLREAVEAYLTQRNLPIRTETEVRSSLRIFEDLAGNKGLDAITRRDFQRYAEHLASQTIGGKTEGSIKRLASRSTLKKRLGLLRAAINHAIDTDKYDGKNPASGIKVDAYAAPPNRAIMPEKRRFTIQEMNLIFQHPWFTGCKSATPLQTHEPGNHRLQGSEYWVPVVAAYTGCRASELGGMLLSEVVLDTCTPHFVIRDNKWRRTKKGEARRIPLLDALVELGFGVYVDRIRQSGAERLFPDWTPPSGKDTDRNDDKQWSNGRIIRSFNRTVIRKALGQLLAPDARQAVTFHGFRGAFKAMLGSSEYRLHPNIINEVAGHEKDGMDAAYVGEIAIEDTYPAIKACRYKNLIINKLEN